MRKKPIDLVFPRSIVGNLGDLVSRWGILGAFQRAMMENLAVFVSSPNDVPDLPFRLLPNGKLKNFILPPESRAALRQAHTVVWAAGLDLQDDSSLMKLVYLWLLFARYRLMKKKIIVLFQGAGPITTCAGRWLTRRVLSNVETIVARDSGSEQLLRSISPRQRVLRGHDGIFLPGIEADAASQEAEADWIEPLFDTRQPVIGLNIRLWFHFQQRLIPYQFAQKQYQDQAQKKMDELVGSTIALARQLRGDLNARVILFSMYKHGVERWENDTYWLRQVKAALADDRDVVLLDRPMSIPQFLNVISRLDLMIGMRLHAALISLRLGVPAINLGYTLKNFDIMRDIGLDRYVIPVETFLKDPAKAAVLAGEMLSDHEAVCQNVELVVSNLVRRNEELLLRVFPGGQDETMSSA
ncbi:MAG: polysaccharide pyruvyl transferase family protein [Anaerolineaceae bacterium]|nr:polysaccharide pyruvyl transferase family protein [Anaerolineaceae bacterium]